MDEESESPDKVSQGGLRRQLGLKLNQEQSLKCLSLLLSRALNWNRSSICVPYSVLHDRAMDDTFEQEASPLESYSFSKAS